MLRRKNTKEKRKKRKNLALKKKPEDIFSHDG
jgi:hypothetical protein